MEEKLGKQQQQQQPGIVKQDDLCCINYKTSVHMQSSPHHVSQKLILSLIGNE